VTTHGSAEWQQRPRRLDRLRGGGAHLAELLVGVRRALHHRAPQVVPLLVEREQLAACEPTPPGTSAKRPSAWYAVAMWAHRGRRRPPSCTAGPASSRARPSSRTSAAHRARRTQHSAQRTAQNADVQRGKIECSGGSQRTCLCPAPWMSACSRVVASARARSCSSLALRFILSSHAFSCARVSEKEVC
jgi:hypothetical protein